MHRQSLCWTSESHTAFADQPLMSSRMPSQLVPLLSVSQSVFHVGAPTTRPSKSFSFDSSVSPMSAGSEAPSPSSCARTSHKHHLRNDAKLKAETCTEEGLQQQTSALYVMVQDSSRLAVSYLLYEASDVLCVPCASTVKNTKLRQADVLSLNGHRASSSQTYAARAS